MPMPYRFTQPCPTCGRQLRIPVELLGREVGCQHCQGQFVAGQEEPLSHTPLHERPLMERVDEMLRQANRMAEPIHEAYGVPEL